MKTYNVKEKKNINNVKEVKKKTNNTKEKKQKAIILKDLEVAKTNAYIIGKERKVEELERECDELQRTINNNKAAYEVRIKNLNMICKGLEEENDILKKENKRIDIINIIMACIIIYGAVAFYLISLI